jgi:cytochrome o ubiquinol oxidase operon protein cyoD
MEHLSHKTYVAGFVASVALTFASFGVVSSGVLPGPSALAAILVLAVAQLGVQLYCFLHLGSAGSGWKAASIIPTFVLILMIVVGSVWIMGHLNYAMMGSPDAMGHYIQDQQGF